MTTTRTTTDAPAFPTAAAIAAEAGVDDFFAEATPEVRVDTIQPEPLDEDDDMSL